MAKAWRASDVTEQKKTRLQRAIPLTSSSLYSELWYLITAESRSNYLSPHIRQNNIALAVHIKRLLQFGSLHSRLQLCTEE